MKRLICILLLAASALCASAQGYKVPTITISETKVEYDGQTYFSHLVREKETLYSICRAYGVTTEEIYMSNTALHLEETVLHTGDILLIPWKQVAEDKLLEQKRAERADSLALVLHHIEDTASLMIDIAHATVTVDTTAIVPVPVDTVQVDTVAFTASLDSLAAAYADSVSRAQNIPFVYIMPETINVTMFLPVNASSKPSEKYLNFYMGAMIAVRELGREGIKINFNTVDTYSTEFGKAAELMESSDVILGPVSAKDIQKIMPSIPEGKYIVSPLDAKTESLAKDNRVILACTPASAQIRDAGAWIREDYNPGDSLCIVGEIGVKRTAAVQSFVDEIISVPGIFHINYEPRSEAVKDAKSDKIVDVFTERTHESDVNKTMFLIASEHDIFISDAMRMIDVQTYRKHNVALYGPAKMRVSDMENMCDANLHVSATYHIDYTDPDVVAFILAYRALYNTDPDSFAFHGYDTAKYFIKACARYGRQWPKKLGEFRMEGLQTDFQFQDSEDKGFVNQAVRRVVYSPGFKAEIVR